jgi:oligopeptide/dipeptide ABC transporter ATP-binding protein
MGGLAVHDLAVSFSTDGQRLLALDGVSLTLTPGRITGIVGESGSGKSALALAMMRLLPRNARIDRGRIMLDTPKGPVDLAALHDRGPQIESWRGRALSIIFQEPMAAFSPVHRIGTQIVEPLRNLRLPRAETRRRGIAALAEVGISEPEQRFDQYAFELSGGMLQRAMIAAALIARPSLLIADEPTTALDVTIQAQVLDLIRGLRNRQGIAVMLITHDLGIVAQTADEVAVMYLGRILERAPVRQIFAAPRHPYTANLLQAVIGPGAVRGALHAIPGQLPGPRDRPSGCAFHPRCQVRIAGRCDSETPVLQEVASGHHVACLREVGS